MTKRLDGRLALVTGASRGIGAALARQLAAEGAHVVATARTQGGLEDLDDAIRQAGGACTLAPLNLAEHDKIDMVAASIHQRFGKLDILVANAGMLGELAPVGHLSPKAWTRTIDLNLTANFRLICAFDPLLRLSDGAHALFATCAEAKQHKAFYGLYAASKAGLEALVESWQRELVDTNVTAHLVDPGPTATKLRAQAFPGEDPNDLLTPEEAARAFMKVLI